MWGTIINSATILTGGLIGTFLNKNLPARFQNIVFQVMGLSIIVMGISMALEMKHMLLCILSLVIGAISGELMRLDVQIDKFSHWVKRTVKAKNERFSEGFISTSILFCVGAMAIIGSIEEGSGQYPKILLTKAVMDGFTSIAFGAAFGIGVVFSAFMVLGYQGLLTSLVILFGSLLSQDIINEVAAVGGVMLIGLGLNLLKVVDIKIINLTPSLVFIGLAVWLFA